MRALVTLCAGAACVAQAFTLGDLRGSAVIGRALDVSVRVQGGAGEEVSAACVGADVYFADARQATPVVTVEAGPDNQSTVRIQLSAIVNEPVVTVLMRATCGSSSLRRYVLLADFPQLSMPVAPVPVVSVDALTKTTLPQANSGAEPHTVLVLPTRAEPVPITPATSKAVPANLQATVPKEPSTPRAVKPAKASNRVESAPSVISKTTSKLVRPAGKSVLKLDPLDILSDRIDSLDSVMLFAPTEDALRHTQEISTLQGDVKKLRDLAAKNDARLADLQTKLQQAQEQQLSPVLWYALTGLVLLCLGALAWLWQKQRQTQKHAEAAWWNSDDSGPSTVLMPQTVRPKTAVSAAAVPSEKSALESRSVSVPDNKTASPHLNTPSPQPKEKTPASVAVPVPEVDLDIDLDSFMLKDNKPAQAVTVAAGTQSHPNSIHHISVEPILDIRQQAEFFVSLGQTDRALRILKKQIAETAEPNPMVYLDLLALYHSLGLKTDYLEQRAALGQLFNVAVPDFSAFTDEGKDLETYPEVLADLTPLWPGARALVFLDACIFFDAKAQVRPMFDLAAFRNLLMLHTLAEELTPGLPSVAPKSVPQPAADVPTGALEPETTYLPTPMPLAAPARQPDTRLSPTIESSDDALAKAFANDLALVPVVPAPTPEPAKALVQVPAKADTSLPEESPSRMLDLDFSSLALPDAEAPEIAESSEPIIKPPVRYATRSRWPVTKKPK